MVDRAINALGGIDILVNNEGVGVLNAPTFEIRDTEAWNKVFEINVRATFLCCQRVGQWMTTHVGK
jgi:NAD(P)-dependent dehydrogenase (short-subunit alcohol dehydrogenase family)